MIRFCDATEMHRRKKHCITKDHCHDFSRTFPPVLFQVVLGILLSFLPSSLHQGGKIYTTVIEVTKRPKHSRKRDVPISPTFFPKLSLSKTIHSCETSECPQRAFCLHVVTQKDSFLNQTRSFDGFLHQFRFSGHQHCGADQERRYILGHYPGQTWIPVRRKSHAWTHVHVQTAVASTASA